MQLSLNHLWINHVTKHHVTTDYAWFKCVFNMLPLKVEEVYNNVNSTYPMLPVRLYPWQEEVLGHLLEKQHVFGMYPTGCGKSMIFITQPLILDQVGNN